MLYRKVQPLIEDYFSKDIDKVLVVTGARQIGKSYIIRYCASKYFPHVIEINLIRDAEGHKIFENVRTTEDFYLALSAFSSAPLGNKHDTLIFLDEIQVYPHLLTMLKFLREEGRFRYVASGSLLGVTLRKSSSVPLGSIDILKMYPLDFEEFLLANDFGSLAINALRENFLNMESVAEGIHSKVMALYKRYLLVGGLPEAVNIFLKTRDLNQVRSIQHTILDLYKVDAAKYDTENSLKISKIYSLIPSVMENKKKRVVYKDIEHIKGKRYSDYEEEIEYLISSGIALGVNAISNPKFPLGESEQKNLVKLYFNDPGLLTGVLYHNNPIPVLNTDSSINLGSVYECAVACQLAANDNTLYYYDNRSRGEVDFLYDDFETLSVVPIEVKSGKDYKRHVAISRMVSTEEYGVKCAYILSNSNQVEIHGKIRYVPVYFSLFFDNRFSKNGPVLI
ncbi:MAG: AAA family ATPase [Muribaculaceae bacterium]|nr:AAA family ATPase [Muribaculaceae bacterium]